MIRVFELHHISQTSGNFGASSQLEDLDLNVVKASSTIYKILRML
jgi:hypothetical protein